MKREYQPTGEQVLKIQAGGGPPPAVSDAMLTLNRLGYSVGLDGSLTIAGEKVMLRVERGAVIAVVGGTPIPWNLFAPTLKRKAA